MIYGSRDSGQLTLGVKADFLLSLLYLTLWVLDWKLAAC